MAERGGDRSASTSGRSWQELAGSCGVPLAAPLARDFPQRVALERLYQLNGQLFQSCASDQAAWAPTVLRVTETTAVERREEAEESPQQVQVLPQQWLCITCGWACVAGVSRHLLTGMLLLLTGPATPGPPREEP